MPATYAAVPGFPGGPRTSRAGGGSRSSGCSRGPRRTRRGSGSTDRGAGSRDPLEVASGLGVDGPRLLRPADQRRGIEVAGEVAPDPVREVVSLVHDEDDLLEGTLDPREDLLSDPAEDVVVVAHDDIGPPRRLHRGLVRARAAGPCGLHQLPPVEDLLPGALPPASR